MPAPLAGEQGSQPVRVALADEDDPGRADHPVHEVLLLGEGDHLVGVPATAQRAERRDGRTGPALHLRERRLLGPSREHDEAGQDAERQRSGDDHDDLEDPHVTRGQEPEQADAHGGAEQEREQRPEAEPPVGAAGDAVGLDDLLDPARLGRSRGGHSVAASAVGGQVVGRGPDGVLTRSCGVGSSGRRPGVHGLTVQPSGAVRRTHQRSRQHPGEADLLGLLRPARRTPRACTHRSTGWWRAEGRRYCVIVTSSQPASCRSRSACVDLRPGLAHAQDQVGLGHQPEVPRLGEHVQRPVVAERRPDPLEDPRHRLDVVGQHLAARRRRPRRAGPGRPLKSGIRFSTPVPGFSSWITRTVSAYSQAPPSGRSSRATPVIVA